MSLKKLYLVAAPAFVLAIVVGEPDAAWAQKPRSAQPQAGENPEEMAKRAIEAIESGDLEQARTLIWKARRIKDVPKLDLAEGLLLIEMPQPQYPEALQRLTDYTKSDEGRNDYRGFAALGKIQKDSRMYRQAVWPLEQAKKLAPAEEKGKPVRAQITMDLATIYLGLGRKKEAMDAAKEAESAATNDPKLQFDFAQIAVGAEEYAVAEPATKRAIELLNAKIRSDPFNMDLHRTLRSCYSLLGRMKEIARRASPDDGALYYALAVVSRDSAEVERRISLLNARTYALQAVEKEPKKLEWQVYVARVESELGAYAEARKRLEEVQRLAPDNQEAAELLKMLPGPAPGESPAK